MAKYRKKNLNKQNEMKAENIIVAIYVMSMLSVFPLIYTNYYFNILQTKYVTFCILTGVMLIALLIWGLISNRMFVYWTEAKAKYSEGGKGFFINWFKGTFNLADRCVMIFYAIVFISTWQAVPYVKQAILGNEGRYTGLIYFTMILGAYFAVSRFFKFSKAYITVFLCAGLFMCIFGITDYFNMNLMGFKTRMKPDQYPMFTSTIGNINTYTTVVGYIIALAGALFITNKDSLPRTIFYFTTMTVGFAAIVMGNSDNAYLTLGAFFGLMPLVVWVTRRGFRRYWLSVAAFAIVIKFIDEINKAYGDGVIGISGLFDFLSDFKYLEVAVITICVIVAILYAVDYGTKASEATLSKYVRYVWAGIIALVVIAIIYMIVKVNSPQTYQEEQSWGMLRNYLLFNDSWGTNRGYIWRACIGEYQKLPILHKIFGTGPDTFGIYMVNNRYDEMVSITHQLYDSAHNEYLQYLFTLGPIGLVSYVTLLISTIAVGIKKAAKSPYMVAIACLVLCYACQATVNINLPIAAPILWVFVAIGRQMGEAKAE